MIDITNPLPDIWVATADSLKVNAVLYQTQEGLIGADSLLLPADSRQWADFVNGKGELNWLFNTHWHSDHCYGNRYLVGKRTSVAAHINYMHTEKREKPLLRTAAAFSKDTKRIPAPHVEIVDRLTLCRHPEVLLIHAPGHSPDSCIAWLERERVVIAGDTVLNSDTGKIAVPYFYWDDPYKLLDSLALIRRINPSLIICGHGNPIEVWRLEQDIVYLETLLELYEKLSSNWHGMAPDAAWEEAKKAILPTSCLPQTTIDDFWLPLAHEYNLKRLVDGPWVDDEQ